MSGDVRGAADFSRDYPIKLGNYISMIDFVDSPTPLAVALPANSWFAGFAVCFVCPICICFISFPAILPDGRLTRRQIELWQISFGGEVSA